MSMCVYRKDPKEKGVNAVRGGSLGGHKNHFFLHFHQFDEGEKKKLGRFFFPLPPLHASLPSLYFSKGSNEWAKVPWEDPTGLRERGENSRIVM